MSSQHIIENNSPVVPLDCQAAFESLTEKEKLYSHYLSRASWTGSLINLFQTSPESPAIFYLFNTIFSNNPIRDLKDGICKELGFTDDDFQSLVIYYCSVVANMGNYKGFGDLKFIPAVDASLIEALVKRVDKDGSLYKLWSTCKEAMYSLEDNVKALGFAPNAVTQYLINCTEEDSNNVKKLMETANIEATNNRVFKREDGVYEIRYASVLETNDPKDSEWMKSIPKLDNMMITRGDYSKILEVMVAELKLASANAANENEVNMLNKYVEHFTTGDLSCHKDGSRFWIKNKGPIVETYIGFIETYRDPAGMRGEFEGFVAVVNKKQTETFTRLVSSAEEFLRYLPWPKQFEKDTFLKPDFTSLDVLTFGGSKVWAGINIPNYNEIRQNEGFKNVSLGNVLSSKSNDEKLNFLSEEDSQLLNTYGSRGFDVQVGLHELLGHGSGKLFRVEKDGSNNFDEPLKDPLTGNSIKCYQPGETYDSKFGSLSSAFEECRAECVGLLLSLESEIVKVFGFPDADIQDIIKCNWLDMCHKGIGSLQLFEPSCGKWLQAHSQARYVITRVLMEGAPNLFRVEKITGQDEKPDLLMHFDGSKVQTEGRKAISDFLLKLQVLKSQGQNEEASELFNRYSAVNDDLEYPFLQFRDISLARRKPRKMLVQASTSIINGSVILKSYEASPFGLIESSLDNFPNQLVSKIMDQML